MLHLLLPVALTVATLGFIIYSVVTSNKNVASFVQLGDIQRRREVNTEIQTQKKQASAANLLLVSPSSPSTATAEGIRQPSLPRLPIAAGGTTAVQIPPRPVVPVSERISFTIGVLNACLTGYIIGLAPTQFYLWYTPKAVVLIIARWIDFRRKSQHYLLYDFCYWANAICLAYLWFFPKSPVMFQILFLCANGPLAWSILAFNQALVFHKWQQITSVFIHVSPMMVTYGIRWYASDFAVCENWPSCSDTSGLRMLWNTLSRFYLWWILLYYLWVFVFLGPYIKSRSFTTLYDRVAGNQMKFLFGPRGALSDTHHLVKKAIYMSMHVIYGTLTMCIALLFWNYWLAQLSFVLTMISCSCWNAALHYEAQFRSDAEILIAGSSGAIVDVAASSSDNSNKTGKSASKEWTRAPQQPARTPATVASTDVVEPSHAKQQ